MEKSHKELNQRNRIIWIITFFLIPIVSINTPYLNLLFFGFEEKVVYTCMVLLFIFRPEIRRVIYLFFLTLGVQFLGRLFHQDVNMEVLGIFLYLFLIYLLYKIFIEYLRGEEKDIV